MEWTGDAFIDTTAKILAIISIAAFILLILLAIIGTIQENKEKAEYTKTLNDHDKAVIQQYQTYNRFFPKLKRKNKNGTHTTNWSTKWM